MYGYTSINEEVRWSRDERTIVTLTEPRRKKWYLMLIRPQQIDYEKGRSYCGGDAFFPQYRHEDEIYFKDILDSGHCYRSNASLQLMYPDRRINTEEDDPTIDNDNDEVFSVDGSEDDFKDVDENEKYWSCDEEELDVYSTFEDSDDEIEYGTANVIHEDDCLRLYGGQTIMHRVYRINDLKKFLYLGYDVDMRDERYETPLHYVTRTRNLNLLKALISAGADVNAENRCGQTPLIIAIAYTCNMEIIKEFLNAGADYSSVMDYFKESVMHRAYTEELVIEFRRRGAKVDAKDIYGYTPLHRACRYAFRSDDKTSAVRGLIRAGADVNRRDDNGKTPLYHAVVRGIWQRIIHLISNGAEFGQVISDDTFQTRKCTAIDKVLSRGRPSLTEAVVQHILLQNWAREINLTSIKEYLLNRSNRSVDDYAKRCGRELSRIKNHMIENYSLFDIMKPHIVYKSIKPLYINYDMIKWEEIHERFPIYRFIISEVINDYKLKTAFMIHMINMTYKSCLYSNDDNTEKSVLLNYDSILMICEYLSFDDLKSFYSALQ